MNLRHAAALALVGWYLMVPPLPLQQDWPLSAWQNHGSYYSAKECASANTALTIEAYEDEKAQNCSGSEDKRLRCQYDDAKQNANCISTDDPRLKEK